MCASDSAPSLCTHPSPSCVLVAGDLCYRTQRRQISERTVSRFPRARALATGGWRRRGPLSRGAPGGACLRRRQRRGREHAPERRKTSELRTAQRSKSIIGTARSYTFHHLSTLQHWRESLSPVCFASCSYRNYPQTTGRRRHRPLTSPFKPHGVDIRSRCHNPRLGQLHRRPFLSMYAA